MITSFIIYKCVKVLCVVKLNANKNEPHILQALQNEIRSSVSNATLGDLH
jgi:hypothetical protein